MKAQSAIELIIVVFFYISVIVMVLLSFYRTIPTEVAKVKTQSACSQAETVSNAFLQFDSNSSNWNNLTNFGLGVEGETSINYSLWQQAKSQGPHTIAQDLNIDIPFYLEYKVYAFNWGSDSTPSQLPNQTSARANLVRESNNLVVYAGTASETPQQMKLKLFFPTSVSMTGCAQGELEVQDTNISTITENGTTIELDWTFGDSDLDCINLSSEETPEIAFIEEMEITNQTIGKKYPIYLGDHTIINSNFGYSGGLDTTKKYCQINRKGLLFNNNEKLMIDIKIKSWR